MAITIQPSDDAFGRFSFSPDSLSRIVSEQPGGVPLTFTVLRAGGTFGLVSIYWQVTQSGDSAQVTDISPASGEVVFADGERQQQFTLSVTDDVVRLFVCYHYIHWLITHYIITFLCRLLNLWKCSQWNW